MKKNFLLFILTLLASTLFAQLPTDSLIAYYPFNGNSNDESGNTFHGEPMGGAKLAVDRNGNTNSCYYFDGVDDYIKIDPSVPIINGHEFTISAWVKAEGTGGVDDKTNVIFAQRDYEVGPYSTIVFSAENPTGEIAFECRSFNGSSNYTTSVNTPKSEYGEWNHIVATLSADSTLTLYVNAVKVDEKKFSDGFIFNNSIDYIDIGKHSFYNSSKVDKTKNNYFNGYIDDLCIYTKGLSEEEVVELNKEGTCSDTIISDTTVYYVSDIDFESESPKVYFEKADSLKTQLGVCDSIVNRYIKYIYMGDPCEYYDTIKVTDTLLIDVSIPTLTDEMGINTLKVYPNPAKDFITINTGTNYHVINDYSIKISSLLGTVIFESEITEPEFQINISEFGANGLYFIHIIDNEQKIVSSKKIILE